MTPYVRSKLHYKTVGDPGGPAILFAHGFMGSKDDWREIVDALRTDFFCIAVDLPGHGGSLGLRHEADYGMEGAADLVRDVLDCVGVAKAHVVGYSMGGRLALYFAIYHNDRCRRLVLESASPGLMHEADRAARIKLDDARARRLETKEYTTFIEKWYRHPMFASLGNHDGLLESRIIARMQNSPPELARSLRMMGTGRQPPLWDRLGHVKSRVLAIAGALDSKYVELAEQMSVLMPMTRTAIIPDAGHVVHAEHPAAYLDLLRDFLKAV